MRKSNKKITKSWICFCIVIIMVFNISITSSARTFDDVIFYSTECKDAISFVADNGYMIGDGDNKFLPETLVTRAMLVTILYSMQGKPFYTTVAAELFPDVQQDDWFYPAVCWAYDNGLVAGSGTGNFSPRSYIKKRMRF